MRRFLVAFSSCGVLLFIACGKAEIPDWLTRVVGDPPAKEALHFTLLCDHSLGSTCDEAALPANLDGALVAVADRPQSSVSVVTLGTDLATTRELARVTVPRPANHRARAQQSEQRRFVDAARAELLRSAQPIFSVPSLRASPLAEGITKITYAKPPQTVVIISDALECSRTTEFCFECSLVPTPKQFVEQLQRKALFAPGSMRGTHLVFVNQRLGTIGGNRCPQTMARVQAVRAAWTAAAKAAGATIDFSTDAFGGEQ
jgi:hypothetical protein